MSKEESLERLESVRTKLRGLEANVGKWKGTTVTNAGMRLEARNIAQTWFELIEPVMDRFKISKEVQEKYHAQFDGLLKLSMRESRKTTYQNTIKDITAKYEDDLIIPVIKSAGKIVDISQLSKILANVEATEKEYLEEALGCAGNGFLRASVVLAWCAAVYRMHKTVEKLGLDEFNKKTVEMKAVTEGRFKRFGKTFSVHSMSELGATVFDNDLLWVLEYWGLIDSNQHERLSVCFTMRNNSGHPGDAGISPENLASFYSDIKAFVFDNPKFKL